MNERRAAVKSGLAAVSLVLCVLLSGCTTVTAGMAVPARGEQVESVRVASSKLVLKDGTDDPKVVVSLYEDFLCPACRRFEETFGPTIDELTSRGSIAVDYYMIAILDRRSNQNYSSRAGGAAYCVSDVDSTPDKHAFMRFHSALFAQQPSETGSTFPTDADLIETARQAGVTGSVAECIDGGRYADLSSRLPALTGVDATPTVRINGADYDLSTPGALSAKIAELVG